MTDREKLYAEKLATLIRKETISEFYQKDKSKFYEFHDVLRNEFPVVFETCAYENFDGSILLRWKGQDSSKEPIMFMNHYDVVETHGEWQHEPFSGDIADGKVWGRGTLDTKGGLFCMLQAAEELMKAGFKPQQDIYFETACTEETDGTGCDAITKHLLKRGIHFSFCIDEGGFILYDPIGGADATFAMIGVAEKAYADVRFIAKSHGGHASTPSKDTPLVRLGKFMAACEKNDLKLFPVDMAPEVEEMLKRMGPTMKAPLKQILENTEKTKPLLEKVLPMFSPTAAALLKTTMAFTMASGSDSTNVLPMEAHVIANMRFSHHQGSKAAIDAVTKLAKKYDIEVVVDDLGLESPICSYDTDQFRLVEKAVTENFKDVKTAPYIMNAASDSRYMARVCDNCMRFLPFIISDEQVAGIHGIDENVDVSTLPPAVDFYKYLMQNAAF